MFKSNTSLPVYRRAEIRELETRALAGLKPPSLMERAGLAAAEVARKLIVNGSRVLVIAGPANNGGDAFVVARHLKSWWFKVDLVFVGDAAKLPADAKAAYAAWQDSDGTTLTQIPGAGQWDLVIDGMYGINLTRNISGAH